MHSTAFGRPTTALVPPAPHAVSFTPAPTSAAAATPAAPADALAAGELSDDDLEAVVGGLARIWGTAGAGEGSSALGPAGPTLLA